MSSFRKFQFCSIITFNCRAKNSFGLLTGSHHLTHTFFFIGINLTSLFLSSSLFVFELLLEVLSNYRDRHSKRKTPKTEFLINVNMYIRGKPKNLLYIPYTWNRNSQKYLIKRLKFEQNFKYKNYNIESHKALKI